MTFSISLPKVLRRTIGQKDLGMSYKAFCSLGMMIVFDALKCVGQCDLLMQALAKWMIWPMHLSSLIRALRECQER